MTKFEGPEFDREVEKTNQGHIRRSNKILEDLQKDPTKKVVLFEESHPDIANILKLHYHGTAQEVEEKLGIVKGTLKIYWNDPPGEWIVTGTKVKRKIPGRNEPCYCGSGKKYKKCYIDKFDYFANTYTIPEMEMLGYKVIKEVK